MKFYLIVANGKQQGLPIPITVDLFVIGSEKSCQLRSQKPGIGPQQCALVMRERKVFIRDLGSGESTIVNGDVVPPSEEWPLHAGDRIQVGPLEFMIQFTEHALSQKDIEEWALKCLDADAETKKPLEVLDDLMKTNKKMETASLAAQAILDRLSAQRGVVKGRLRIAKEEGITAIRINDTYLVEEAELALLKKELYDNLAYPNLRVLLDFKNVRRISSSAAEMFGDLHTWLKPWGSSLAFCRLRPELQDMLLNFPALIGIRVFADKPAAMSAKW